MSGAKASASSAEAVARCIADLLLNEAKVKELAAIPGVVDDALACAVARGVVMYRQPDAKAQANAIGVTLLPTPIAADLYDEARSLSADFHVLMDRITCDLPWLTEALKETGRMDQICGRLLGICERVYGEGRKDHSKDIRCHVMRNDFMLDTSCTRRDGLAMKQIELNMIAASFATHAEDLTEVHRYVLTKYLPRVDASLSEASLAPVLERMLPRSPNAEGLAAALADGLRAYAARWPASGRQQVVLFVADTDEKNELDHRKLELALFRDHGILSLRRSLAQLAAQITPPSSGTAPRALVVDGYEAAVAYFRSGYWPGHFEPLEECWAAREAIEASEAVKCPSAPAQLAGMKKVQQLLCDPVHLHRFMGPEQAARLARTFALQVDPSNGAESVQEHVRAAKAAPTEWVLKPQVEGSGELFFDEDIPRVLNSRPREELAEFILMERVRPPVTPSAVYRAEDGQRAEPVVRASVGELGIYGSFVADGRWVLRNEAVGHLLRSKGHKTNQGGVFVGNAVVDAPILVPSDLFWPAVSS